MSENRPPDGVPLPDGWDDDDGMSGVNGRVRYEGVTPEHGTTRYEFTCQGDSISVMTNFYRRWFDERLARRAYTTILFHRHRSDIIVVVPDLDLNSAYCRCGAMTVPGSGQDRRWWQWRQRRWVGGSRAPRSISQVTALNLALAIGSWYAILASYLCTVIARIDGDAGRWGHHWLTPGRLVGLIALGFYLLSPVFSTTQEMFLGWLLRLNKYLETRGSGT